MNKFLKLIKEQTPTGAIPTGAGINQPQTQPPTQVAPNKTSMGQIGGAMRKIGTGFDKVKHAIATAKEFSKTGDFSILKDLGQQLLNRDKDMDTYKISLFGKKGYDRILIVDKGLISKIGLQKTIQAAQPTSESTNIIISSGLINTNKFVSILNEAAPEESVPQVASTQSDLPDFLFSITNEKNIGEMGKQYTLTPVDGKLQKYLNDNGIKFITFLRTSNTSQSNIFGYMTFDNNGGKLQMYDMNGAFLPNLETDVRFEYSPQDKVYKIGSAIASHSFADIEESDRLLKLGVIVIYPADKVWILPRTPAPQVGKEVRFINNQTKQAYTGLYNPTISPDKKTTFVVMTNVKPANAASVAVPQKPTRNSKV